MKGNVNLSTKTHLKSKKTKMNDNAVMLSENMATYLTVQLNTLGSHNLKFFALWRKCENKL